MCLRSYIFIKELFFKYFIVNLRKLKNRTTTDLLLFSSYHHHSITRHCRFVLVNKAFFPREYHTEVIEADIWSSLCPHFISAHSVPKCVHKKSRRGKTWFTVSCSQWLINITEVEVSGAARLKYHWELNVNWWGKTENIPIFSTITANTERWGT